MKKTNKTKSKVLVAKGQVVTGNELKGYKQVGKPMKGEVVIPFCKTCG